MMFNFKTLALASACAALPGLAGAVVVTVGPGGFDNGYATTITYDTDAARGTSYQRDNPLNALGAPDGVNPGDRTLNGGFFEMGFGSTVDFTFGTLFGTEAMLWEITFGSPASFPESVDVWVGSGIDTGFAGSFVTSVSNSTAAFGATVMLPTGPFETVRLIDTSSPMPGHTVGGFDVDSVRVTPAPVPVPAAGLLLFTALGGAAALKRRKS